MDLRYRATRMLHGRLQGLCFLILTLLTVNVVYAHTPEMMEKMVYRLRVFNGHGYQELFCPHVEETIYVIADSDSVFDPKMTLVYYWPISRRYKFGFKTIN